MKPRKVPSIVDTRNARDHAFLALFTLSLAWALFQIGVMLMLSGGSQLVAREDFFLRNLAENWEPPIVAAIVAGLITSVLVRLAPHFLRVPAHVTTLRLSVSLSVAAASVALLLFLIPMAVTMVVDPPGPRPDDVQHIPIAFWIAPWAAGALTPVAAILIAWRWAVRTSK
jgi:hypothetical protein